MIITAGGKQALYNTAMVLFDHGDEVITHAPYWPTIPEQVKLAGAEPVVVQTSPEDAFADSCRAILAAITPRTKAIIINSPSNPAGRPDLARRAWRPSPTKRPAAACG